MVDVVIDQVQMDELNSRLQGIQTAVEGLTEQVRVSGLLLSGATAILLPVFAEIAKNIQDNQTSDALTKQHVREQRVRATQL